MFFIVLHVLHMWYLSLSRKNNHTYYYDILYLDLGDEILIILPRPTYHITILATSIINIVVIHNIFSEILCNFRYNIYI